MPTIFGPLSLGELVAKLTAAGAENDDRAIYFDWCQMHPGEFCSYRGHYDHLAIIVTPHHYELAGDFLDRLTAQFGAEHTGYKGGRYKMGGETPVWITSGAGDCPGFGIIDVKADKYTVTLVTKNFDEND